jgi:hypothetical protein
MMLGAWASVSTQCGRATATLTVLFAMLITAYTEGVGKTRTVECSEMRRFRNDRLSLDSQR